MHDGDPRLIVTGDGLEISMENGNIFTDDSPFNAIVLSLFPDKNNDHQNVLLSSEKYKLESKTLLECRKPITLQSIKNIKKAIKYDLKPLVDDGLIWNVDTEVKNTTSRIISIKIYCEYSGGIIEKEFIYNNGIIEVV